MKRNFSLFVAFTKKFEISFSISQSRPLLWLVPEGFRNMDGLITLRICQQNLRQVSNKEDLFEEKLKNVRRKYINLILRKAGAEKNVEQIS